MDQLFVPAPPGLDAADLAFRLYLDGEPEDGSALGVVEHAVDAAASLYLVTGRPVPGIGETWDISWSVAGAGASHRWPVLGTQPPGFLLALREDGLDLADVGAALWYGGLGVALGAITFEAVGSPADYWLSGLPVPDLGAQYTLTYHRGGVYGSLSWPTQLGLPAGEEGRTYHQVRKLLRARLKTWGVAAGVPVYAHREVPSDPPATGYLAYGIEFGRESVVSRGQQIVRVSSLCVLEMELFLPRDEEGTAWVRAQELANLFRSWASAGVHMLYWRTEEPLQVAGGAYYQLNLYGGFERHENQARAAA